MAYRYSLYYSCNLSVIPNIYIFFWKDHSGCRVKSQLDGGGECWNRGPGVWRTKSRPGEFLSSKPAVENFMHVLYCLFTLSLVSSGWQRWYYLLLKCYQSHSKIVWATKLLFFVENYYLFFI